MLVENLCAPYYADGQERLSIPQEQYLRMHLDEACQLFLEIPPKQRHNISIIASSLTSFFTSFILKGKYCNFSFWQITFVFLGNVQNTSAIT